MKIDGYLTAHGFMNVERPPLLWAIDCDDDGPFLRTLGEMIVMGLGRGNDLIELVLNVNNVTVQPDEDEPDERLPPGDYVALTIKGRGDWGPELAWWPGHSTGRSLLCNVENEAAGANVRYIYTRSLGDAGSVTVMWPRLGE